MGHTSFVPDEELDALPPLPSVMPDQQCRLPTLPDRTLWSIDLRNHDRPEPVLAEVERIAAAAFSAPSDEPASAASGVTRVEETTQPRWHPVIDFSRCNGCQDCVQFCVFKVLGVDNAGTLLVLRPDNCHKVCAACARICPTGAIQLPRHCYPALAGDPSAPREGMKNNPSPSPGATSPEDLGRMELSRTKALGRSSKVDRPQCQEHSVGRAPTRPPHARQELSLDGPGTPAG